MDQHKTFIEIGTSDFDTLIPLAKQGWKGIFVEPVKPLLDNLERIDGCHYINKAIWTYNGSVDIVYPTNINEYSGDDEWIKGIGRLSGVGGAHSLFYWDDDLLKVKERSISKKVESIKLDTLIESFQLEDIDFLKIDIEGLEYKILEDYSWNIKPKILKFEFAHWTSKDNDNKDRVDADINHWITRLEDMGYIVYKEKEDVYAIL